jgi:hypothetical protein
MASPVLAIGLQPDCLKPHCLKPHLFFFLLWTISNLIWRSGSAVQIRYYPVTVIAENPAWSKAPATEIFSGRLRRFNEA